MVKEITANAFLDANGEKLEVRVLGLATVAFQVGGTWTGTLQFEGTVDGKNWFSLTSTPMPIAATVVQTTASGAWIAYCHGLLAVRVRASAAMTGSAEVTITAVASGGGPVNEFDVDTTGLALESGGNLADIKTNTTPKTGTPTESAVNVTTGSTDVLAANAARKYLQLINDSDTDIYVSIDGGAAALHTGTRLNANGGSITFDGYVPVGTVKAIHGGTGNKVLLVTEG